MTARWITLATTLVLTSGLASAALADVAVGSKKFTESVILAEAIALALEREGVPTVHRAELGGSRLLFNALRAGELDAYVEYSGTLARELLSGRVAQDADLAALVDELARDGLRVSRPLGFSNTYALGMTEAGARAASIVRISDLAGRSDLRFAVSNEFLERADGWRGLVRRYQLRHDAARGMDHDLAYRALAAGSVDVIDVYTTDAEIAHYGLRVLDDDRAYFSDYDAVVLYRADLETRHAAAWRRVLDRIEGSITASRMSALNASVKIDGKSERAVAATLMDDADTEAVSTTMFSRLATRTVEHLALVLSSLGAAILLALPLGILAAARPRVGAWILSACGIVQTIPSLALLVFMIPLLGIGGPPAVAALFLYSLLPIVRNTHAGLMGIAPELREVACAIGLDAGERLRLIELPLALPSIAAGIKTAAVINVGTATLGALVGAGGYGQPILTGIRLDDTALILEGAVPAAALAVAVQASFDRIERRWDRQRQTGSSPAAT